MFAIRWQSYEKPMRQLLDLSKLYVWIVYITIWTNETHAFGREKCIICEENAYLCIIVNSF